MTLSISYGGLVFYVKNQKIELNVKRLFQLIRNNTLIIGLKYGAIPLSPCHCEMAYAKFKAKEFGISINQIVRHLGICTDTFYKNLNGKLKNHREQIINFINERAESL